jgi:hypothetical protein
MKKPISALAFLAVAATLLMAVEGGKFRLLSVSGTSKMVLVSRIPDKTKFVLDASTAKITVDGKPAEFSALAQYSVINVKFDQKKSEKAGIALDGIATEIRVSTPENPKSASEPPKISGTP